MYVEYIEMGVIEICFIGVLQKTITAIGVQYAWFFIVETETTKTLINFEIGPIDL